MKLEAVLLDMGGVLLDMANEQGLPTGRLDFRGREVLAHAIKSAGGRIDGTALEDELFAPWRQEYEKRRLVGQEAAWEPHLKRLRKLSGSGLRNLTLLGAWFAPYAETVQPIAGAREVVANLAARGLKLAVVSNVPLPGKLYHRLLVQHGLADFIQSWHWSYDAGSRKPSPAMPRAALAALGVSPSAAVMVGDRRGADVAAGLAAGVGTVWLRSNDGGGPRPDVTIATLRDLPEALALWSSGATVHPFGHA
jgi:HAD superfamily hydrolase (TIGR01509 family)